MNYKEYTLIGGSNDGVRVKIPDGTEKWQMFDRNHAALGSFNMTPDNNSGLGEPPQNVRVEEYIPMKSMINFTEFTWFVEKNLNLVQAIRILYNNHRNHEIIR